MLKSSARTVITLLLLLVWASFCHPVSEDDLNISCAPNQTACYYGCCPYPNATCCSDGFHCCPHGETCLPWVGICWNFGYQKISKTVELKQWNSKDTRSESVAIAHYDYSKSHKGSESKLAENNKFSKMLVKNQTIETCSLNMTRCGEVCCPLIHATCCSDDLHCCPKGYQCDLESKSCTKKVDITRLEEHQCPSGMTECGMSCCPFPEAVCCSDFLHCCPKGYVCDLRKGMCEKNDLSENEN